MSIGRWSHLFCLSVSPYVCVRRSIVTPFFASNLSVLRSIVTPFLSFCRSVRLSVRTSIVTFPPPPPLFSPLSVSPYVRLSLCLLVCLSVRLPVSVRLFVSSSVRLSVLSGPVCTPACLSVCLSARQPVSLFACLPAVSLSVCLCVSLISGLSVRLFNLRSVRASL